MIAALKLKRLKDDKNLWPPYYVVPVVRKEALDANPKIAEVLNRVSAMLDEATMAEMNYKVDGEKMEPQGRRARLPEVERRREVACAIDAESRRIEGARRRG